MRRRRRDADDFDATINRRRARRRRALHQRASHPFPPTADDGAIPLAKSPAQSRRLTLVASGDLADHEAGTRAETRPAALAEPAQIHDRDLGVLMTAEQILQVGDGGGQPPRGLAVQLGVRLQGVPQPLRTDAQLVVRRRRRGGRHVVTDLAHLAHAFANERRRHIDDREPPASAAQRRTLQDRREARDEPLVARTVEDAHHAATGSEPATAKRVRDRRQPLGVVGVHLRTPVVEVGELYVDIAHGTERARDPLQCRRGRDAPTGQDVLEQRQHRTQTTDRHAHVVERLRILAEPGTGLRREHVGEIAAQRRERERARRHRRVDRARRVEERRRDDAADTQRRRKLRLVGRLEPHALPAHLHERLELRGIDARRDLHLDALKAHRRRRVFHRHRRHIERQLAHRPSAVLDRQAAPARPELENRPHRMRAGDGVQTVGKHAFETLDDAVRLRAVTRRARGGERHRGAELAPLVATLARGAELLQRRLARVPHLSDAQRVARAVQAPILRIVVGVGDVAGGRRTQDEPLGERHAAQPALRRHRALELPLRLDVVVHRGRP